VTLREKLRELGKWALILSPVALGVWVLDFGGPIFLGATTLTELLKGLILCGLGVFVAVFGFIFIGTSLK